MMESLDGRKLDYMVPSRTDVLVSENLTVPILGDRWSAILVPANPPAVISSGHVALRQTEIGQLRSYAAGANR